MRKIKKKSKVTFKSILPYIIGAAIGAIIGAIAIGSNEYSEDSSSKAFIWISLLIGLTSFYVGVLIHIVLHEAGHLVCGLMSGYRFVSFTVGNVMLIKENGNLKVKRYGIAGVGGQCLMSPPEPAGGTYPYKLYYLGGFLANLLTSAVFLLLFMLLRDIFHYAREAFLPIAFVGVLLGLFNILPLKLGGLAVDGHNLFALGKKEHTRRANWLLLTIVARLVSGERSRDFPAEWFEFDEDYDFNDTIMANVAGVGISRLIDSRDFSQAKFLAERILCEGRTLIELLQNETRCELLFLAIIDESGQNREDEIAGLFTPELKKYIKASKTQLSKHRLMYAYEKLVSFDDEKAIKSRESFNKAYRLHPYSGDRESERELIDIVDRLAGVYPDGSFTGVQ